MIHSCPIWLALLLAISLQPNTAAAQIDDLRTIEFETSKVTGADVALSPDGTQLIFTLLGHLFAVPVEGGDAQQLTFGPYQHADPVFSPDGNRVAFASNRDGNDGNIFILDLATESVVQVTHEKEAARPAWSPDGMSIAYISYLARGHHCPDGRSILRRVVLLVDQDPAQVSQERSLAPRFELLQSIQRPEEGHLHKIVGFQKVPGIDRQPPVGPSPQNG